MIKLICILFTSILILGAEGQPRRRNAQVHQPKTYAFITGVSNYRDSLFFPHLHFAKTDADQFHEFLLKGYIPGIKTEDIVKISVDTVTCAYMDVTLSQWLRNVESKAKAGDYIFIYWSGHGAISDVEQSLACYDTEFIDDENTLRGDLQWDIRISLLKSSMINISNNGVKVFLIVDACRSMLKGVENISTVVNQLTGSSTTNGDIYMFSANNGERSYETNKLLPGSGVFTHFLLLGLSGAADNFPTDGQVTLSEIETFVRNVTPYVTNVLKEEKPQIPSIVYNHLPENTTLIITKNIPANVVNESRRKAAALLSEVQEVNSVNVSSRNITISLNNSYLLEQESDEGNQTLKELYAKILSNISNEELIRPKGYSAYDNYNKLIRLTPDTNLVIEVRSQLTIALQDKVKSFMDSYIRGKLGSSKRTDFDLAAEELSLALDLRPANDPFKIDLLPKLNFLRARALAASHNPKDWIVGLKIIDSTLAKSKAAYMYHTKGVLYENKSRFYSAINFFDSALKYSPNWTYGLYNLATTYYQIQEYEKSIAYCERVIQKDSNNSRMYSWLAYNYETIINNDPSSLKTLNNYKRAIQYNTKALETDSTNTYAYLNLGRIYFNLGGDGNYQKAKYYFSMGGEKFGDSQCLTWLGKVYESTESLDTATFYYKEAWRLNNFDTAALNNYANFLFSQGKLQMADSLFSVALQITKDTVHGTYDYKFLSKYRSFVFKCKSPTTADSIFREVVTINNEDPFVFIEHSQQWENLDSISKARDILRLGLMTIPKSPSLSYAMALLIFKYYESSILENVTLDSSIYYLKASSLGTEPNSSLFNWALGRIYLEKNDLVSAEAHFLKADSLNQYIYFTKNFDKDITTLGDSAIRKKNFSGATYYYKKVKSLNDQNNFLINSPMSQNISQIRFESSMDVARALYLNHELDSAEAYCLNLQTNQKDFEDEEILNSNKERQQSLLGLINIERNNKNGYRKAIEIFSELDNSIRETPIYLEQAVAYYCLGNKKTAIRLATNFRNSNKSMLSYMEMVNQDEELYSLFYIDKLQQLINETAKSISTK